MIIIDTQTLVGWITSLIAEDKIYKFYKSKEWIALRQKVLQEHHYECSHCRANGKIKKAETVHHVHHVKEFPQYALTQYIIDEQGNHISNLIPLCNACHNKEHPEKTFKARTKNKPVTDERWD